MNYININYDALRTQKHILLTKVLKTLNKEDSEEMEGLLNLIDTIQDNAVELKQKTELEVFGRLTDSIKYN